MEIWLQWDFQAHKLTKELRLSLVEFKKTGGGKFATSSVVAIKIKRIWWWTDSTSIARWLVKSQEDMIVEYKSEYGQWQKYERLRSACAGKFSVQDKKTSDFIDKFKKD